MPYSPRRCAARKSRALVLKAIEIRRERREIRIIQQARDLPAQGQAGLAFHESAGQDKPGHLLKSDLQIPSGEKRLGFILREQPRLARRRETRAGVAAAIPGCSPAWMSARACVMNSISTNPPGRSFTSKRSRPGFSVCISARMEAVSRFTFAASRLAATRSRMLSESAADSPASPVSTGRGRGRGVPRDRFHPKRNIPGRPEAKPPPVPSCPRDAGEDQPHKRAGPHRRGERGNEALRELRIVLAGHQRFLAIRPCIARRFIDHHDIEIGIRGEFARPALP